MADPTSKVIYTHTDEAPALATYSLLPIIRKFAQACGVDVETRDISLSGRVLANFPEYLTAEQKIGDALTELGELATRPEANIIKLPNISASIPQLKVCIKELQDKGYKIPSYPDQPKTDEEKEAQARYDRIKGSAVNPVLREGNSDRRAPRAVKNYARANPHSMGKWSSDSKSHVANMQDNDFFANEKSVTIKTAGQLRIELVDSAGKTQILKDKIPVLAGEVIDATFMNVNALRQFIDDQISDAKANGVLFSLHLKATMMKVSDPIIFGHVVKRFFSNVFDKHGPALAAAGVNVNNGLGNLLTALEKMPADTRAAIEADIKEAMANGPSIAMVDSDKGITNLHVPSDVIVDASMPAMIRSSGQMWNQAGELQDTKAVIPDTSYASLYQETIAFCQKNGAFDPATMGSVPNVGLMAQKAEEYGSHDKTFEIPSNGTVRIVDDADTVLIEHQVAQGDIWRACQTKDAPIRDWVKLAVSRGRATGSPVVFWLDASRAHDAQIIAKVNAYLPEHDTKGLDIQIMSVAQATRFTLQRCKDGQDTISATGNVLRDYLTDLFPILELGTSAKMLSVVPLMNGGGLFETGAGGSAPKHVQQLISENHLRWDSLGEFLALSVSLEHLGKVTNNRGAEIMGAALDEATGQLLTTGKSPKRRVRELDNRGSHFYLALYWAQAMAAQKDDEILAGRFAKLAKTLADSETTIVSELNEVQGQRCEIGGYYLPDPTMCDVVMRPSQTFNSILESFS
ncbi:MAG: NADP-dependent isocitrate dehydrogenase [Burkholderiaceae bacterium]